MPRATANKKPRTTRTKKDVEEGLAELTERTANAEALDPQAAGLAAERATAIRSKVSGLSVDTIVENAAKFSLQVGRTINELTEQCVAKAQELKDLQEANEIEKAELERLYDLDIASASVQALLDDHETRKTELEAEIAEKQREWNEEQINHEKAIRLRNAELEAARKKEAEEFNYRTLFERNKAKDEYDRRIALLEREHSDRQAAFDKQLAEHTAKMAAETEEIEKLRARIGTIDAEIHTAVAKAEKIKEAVLSKEHEHTIALLNAEWKSKLDLEQQKVANLEKNNTELARQVLALTAEVKEAHAKVAETAKEALLSASGQTALAKVMELQQSAGPNGQRSGSKS
jgi:chromosome segregation ATPase